MYPLNGALPGRYVPVRVPRCALVAHRYTYAPPHCRTLQYSRTFIPFSVSLWNDFLTAYSIVWAWRVARAEAMLFYWPQLPYPTVVFYYFSLSLLSVYRLVLWDWGLSTDKVFGLITLSQPCTADLF